MRRRLVIRILSLALMLAAAATVRAAEPLRLSFDAGKEPIDLSAKDVTTWEENQERVFLLREKVAIQTSNDLIRADRAVVWISIEKNRNGAPTRGEVYVEGNVAVRLNGQQRQTADQTMIRFTTTDGLKADSKSRIAANNRADDPLYHTAAVVRQGSSVPVNNAYLDPNVLPAQVKSPQPFEGIIQPVQNTAPPKLDPVPGPPLAKEPPLFETPPLPLPPVSTRKLKIGNRSANPTYAKYMKMPNSEQVALITGGIKLLATFPERGNEILDVEADELVIWQKGGTSSELVEAMRDNDGVTQGNDRETELFLTGNVIIRYGSTSDRRNLDGSLIDEKVMKADKIYYDVTRNKAIALDGVLIMNRNGLSQPAYLKSRRIEQLSTQEFHMNEVEASASVLPADPGLNFSSRTMELTEQKEQVRRTIFGFPVVDRFTGEDDIGTVRHYKARSAVIEAAGVPVMWFPYLAGDPTDPTGPLQSLNYRNDSIFGSQFYTTWSLLELLGIKKLPNERWNLMVDYLTMRGPAAGTSYNITATKLFGIEAPFTTTVLAYGIYDSGFDNLGGTRNYAWTPTGMRGRAEVRHQQDYENLSFQGQFAYLSDRNFQEQYYKYDFDMGANQETFIYLKYQSGNGAATLLTEPNFNRYFVTETQWLPKLEGYWLGQNLFNRLTYNAWGSAGYANLHTFNLPSNEYPSGLTYQVPQESPDKTARFDFMQQLSAPFQLGPVKWVPYVNGDLTWYSNDEQGNQQGRLYGGAGVRASMPLSRLYDGVESEYLNLHGIYHKTVFAANYYTASSNVPYTSLPQLDRMNDDATQQSVRDMQPWQPTYVEGSAGVALLNSPLYDPRAYALRRLMDTRVDALDTIEVVQAEMRQRWQTKRGYPGQEHTVDYVTFDLSASFFPAKNRDNFGHPVSFIEYNASWAVGDRNGFTSAGWIDPFDNGTRYWNITSYFTRPDGTNVYLSYRSFDPVHSRVLSLTFSYVFSPKYSISYSTSYDFGITNNQSNSLSVIRTGTDLTWSLGFSYNALINNFGFSFMIVPNLMAQKGGVATTTNAYGNTGGYYGRQ